MTSYLNYDRLCDCILMHGKFLNVNISDQLNFTSSNTVKTNAQKRCG